MARPLYDAIGGGYATTRAADPRIAAAIRVALGDARSVVNVGAGAGAYEPDDLDVVAVEPSPVMIAQRPAGSAPCVQASAERLPLADASVDAALAVLSDHHWHHRAAGLRELRRVARRRVVLVNVDPAHVARFWLVRDYLPGAARLVPQPYRAPGHWSDELERLLGPLRVEPVPVPHDCRDGFFQAFWRRPRAYLDERVRANISVFRGLPVREVADALRRLEADLERGEWERRNGDLVVRAELDVGLRLVVAERA